MELRSTKHFKRGYKKLPPKVRAQFSVRLTLYTEDPHHPKLNLHKLSGEYKGCWSINVTGDYRLAFKLVDEHTLLLVKIGTHAQLYG